MTAAAATARRTLLADRQAIAARLESAARLGPGREVEQGDEVARLQDVEITLVDRGRLTARLREIDAALERLAAGTWGTCLDCGGPIEASRLKARPEVPTCIRCQERREYARQRGLGPWADGAEC